MILTRVTITQRPYAKFVGTVLHRNWPRKVTTVNEDPLAPQNKLHRCDCCQKNPTTDRKSFEPNFIIRQMIHWRWVTGRWSWAIYKAFFFYFGRKKRRLRKSFKMVRLTSYWLLLGNWGLLLLGETMEIFIQWL